MGEVGLLYPLQVVCPPCSRAFHPIIQSCLGTPLGGTCRSWVRMPTRCTSAVGSPGSATTTRHTASWVRSTFMVFSVLLFWSFSARTVSFLETRGTSPHL